MKRFLLAVMCACVLVVGLVGCSDPIAASKTAFTGTWQIYSMTDGETERAPEDIDKLRDMGMNVYLELNEDGTAVLNLFGSEDEGSWEPKTATTASVTLSSGAAVEMTISDDKLSMKENDNVLTFSKVDPADLVTNEPPEGTTEDGAVEGEVVEGEIVEPTDATAGEGGATPDANAEGGAVAEDAANSNTTENAAGSDNSEQAANTEEAQQ